jgi:hypothetical protein
MRLSVRQSRLAPPVPKAANDRCDGEPSTYIYLKKARPTHAGRALFRGESPQGGAEAGDRPSTIGVA